jgi:hypothetical protein
MKALKLAFFADRFHLRQFGRPITNDECHAMEYGPVPSGCKDLAEITHAFPEWKRHEIALHSPDVSRTPMSYRHFLDNAPTAVDPAPALSPDDQQLRCEEIEELQAIESLWA